MKNYHDAVLAFINFDWESGKTRITMRLSSQETVNVEIEAINVIRVVIDHCFPWGKSVNINSLSVIPYEENYQMIEIEMQSGDRIIIIGSNVIEHIS